MSHNIPRGEQGRDLGSTLVEALGDKKCYCLVKNAGAIIEGEF